ncbi:MAG: hypothetical protein LBJ92_04310 [Holosporales bacterium]|jgi:hypothetical protein|nr:hypothetical protein [Holosporales bacterium]
MKVRVLIAMAALIVPLVPQCHASQQQQFDQTDADDSARTPGLAELVALKQGLDSEQLPYTHEEIMGRLEGIPHAVELASTILNLTQNQECQEVLIRSLLERTQSEGEDSTVALFASLVSAYANLPKEQLESGSIKGTQLIWLIPVIQKLLSTDGPCLDILGSIAERTRRTGVPTDTEVLTLLCTVFRKIKTHGMPLQLDRPYGNPVDTSGFPLDYALRSNGLATEFGQINPNLARSLINLGALMATHPSKTFDSLQKLQPEVCATVGINLAAILEADLLEINIQRLYADRQQQQTTDE